MIKCNATVIGTVSRDVEIKNGNNGQPFVTFGMKVDLKEEDETRSIDISVASDGEDNAILDLQKGDHIKVKGVLTFKKIGDSLYFNLSAESVDDPGWDEDSIAGKMQFRGTLGGKEILEKKGKKGNYRFFDAYSSEKIADDQYSYIWVHFIDFNNKRPDWLASKAKIEVDGELELQFFKGRTNINCHVDSLEKWNIDSNKQ